MKKLFLVLIIITNILSAIEMKSIFNEVKETKEEISGKEVKTLRGHSDGVRSLYYSPDGKSLASGSWDNTIKLWDVETGKEIKTLRGHSDDVNSLSYSPDGKSLASGSSDDTIKLWDVGTGKEVKTLKGHSDGVSSLYYSPDGKSLASGSWDNTIKLWDVGTGKEVKTLKGHSDGVSSLYYSPDGKYLASGSWDNTIKLWDVGTGKEIKTLRGHSDCVRSLSYSPDGKYLASGSWDNTIKLWDVGTGKEVKTLKGHSSWVSSLFYSPDGKYLVSGSFDDTIKLWDVGTGKEVKTLKGHSDYVKAVSLSPDGKYIASGSIDDTIKIWNMYNYSNKARIKNMTTINNENNESIGALPKNLVVEISKNAEKIYKPLNGKINQNDFETLYTNNDSYFFYTLNNTPIYIDADKTKILSNIEKGKTIKILFYSYDLGLMYIEEGNLKGWIETKNIGFLNNKNTKVAVINNNTKTYQSINGQNKYKYNSGDIIETNGEELDYFYSEKLGWIAKKDVAIINELEKNKRIFANNKEVNFNADLTGNSYKNVSIGTEYILLGTTDKYNLVQSKNTGEKGWVSKVDMSFTKPDLNDPVILITNTNVDSNNMLTISGKIYDDTAINSFLLNDNKMTTKPLNTFDKLSYTPEVGYSFTSQWFLIEGMENNVEIKVTDRDGKTYSKVLQYTPELKTVNLNEFQIENIVKKLPKLEYSMELKDENNDGVLSGTEKMNLIVKVVNTGDGEAKNVNLKVNGTNPSLLYNNTYPLGTVKPNETKIAVIEIKGKDDNISLTKSNFDLAIEEANGFNPFPAKFSFNTEPKLNPKLEIIDYAIDDDNKNGQIEQGEKFDLYVLIQNTGEGEAKNPILDIKQKANGIIPMAETTYKFDSLKSGESKKIKFTFVTNYIYKGNGNLPFDISFYDEKSKVEKPITLAMNKVVPTIKEVNLEAKKKEIKIASKISIMSDIDDTSKLIAKSPNPKKWAVVIGVENYKKAPYVEFAERDALVTKEYFNKLLGVPTENTFYLSNSDATYGELKVLLKDKLKNRVAKDDEVYFYFSGHGVPTNEGDSYLLLNDSDPSNPEISAYAIKELYQDLGELKTSKSYAFLDTCFSGGTGRTDKVDTLLEGTRPGVMKVNDISLAYNNLVIFTATDKNQLSNSYKEQNHGLFTYYILKGLGGEADKNKDKNISLDELQTYIKDNVSRESSKLGQTKVQEPLLKTTINKQTVIYLKE